MKTWEKFGLQSKSFLNSGRFLKGRTKLLIFKFINSKNNQELEELEIEDKIETILEVRKVLTKRNLMRQLEEKGQNMTTCIHILFAKLEPLYKK